MPRSRILLTYTAWTVGLVILFVLFIAFREDAALVSALSAAGTVAAGVFAAIAAMGSMRAAAESSASARRAREGVARAAKPRVQPSLTRDDGALIGTVTCGDGPAAIDVFAVWVLTNRGTVSDKLAHLEPQRPDTPPGAAVASAVNLGIPDTADAAKEITMVWIEYWDEGRVGLWRDSWKVGTEPPNEGLLLLTDSRLAD